ncbi:MAG: hypothetical protein QG674_305 [Patescibacteria group bacterium]|nr:hypothetical protein [Patescibacteria group bacterium]
MIVKKTKTYAELLKDLFRQYKEIYPNEVYEAYEHSADICKCLRLSNQNVVDFNAPTLILKQWGEDVNNLELSILAWEPYRDYNEKFPAKIFSINTTGHNLHGNFNRVLGDIGSLIVFDEDSILYNDLVIELITKTNSLISSGTYGLKAQPVLFG